VAEGRTEGIPVVGAGSVGLVLAARLARAGRAVRLHVRRHEDARALRSEGIRVEDPATGRAWWAGVDAAEGPPAGAEGAVFLCVRGPDTESAASALAAASPRALPVNVQNGVDGDAVVAHHFERVVGAVWRLPCTRVAVGRVRTLPGGRIVLGLHPEGVDADVEVLAVLLRTAGFDVGLSSRIGEDRWLKLCLNLTSAPNALVRQAEHATATFVETKARLLEEARAVLAASAIPARSADGRDRSLEAEIAWQRGALARGDAARPIPLYNSVWQGLASGAPLECDAYHRTIVSLGRRHGVPTPVNARVLALLEDARDRRLGPESFGADVLAPSGPGSSGSGAPDQ
jgi:2-dehydropantoate 2-reductase